MTRLKVDEIVVPREAHARMRDALERSGWEDYTGLGHLWHHNHKDEFVQAALASQEKALAALDEVIDALGIREEYQDVSTDVVTYNAWGAENYVARGAQRFLDDVRAATAAKASEAAAARLAGALKRAR